MSDIAIPAELVAALPYSWPEGRRYVIAIAGPPASGKSTLAANLRTHIGAEAAVLGMDAFHLDNAILEERDHIKHKGAPHTFDVDGYRRTLQLLRDNPKEDYVIPVFDRELELSRNCASVVANQHSVLITEGNYLLVDHEPWSLLRPQFDLTIFCSPSLATIETRLTDRWLGYGYSPSDAYRKVHGNDLNNAEFVLLHRSNADITLG